MRSDMTKKIVVGMSGGVDSSVAAYLLKEQGYEVIGVTMQIWQEERCASQEAQGGSCGLSAVEDACRVAELLNIPHYVMNFREEFRKNVIDYFIDEYRRGRTPNPCIVCNRSVKWESLLKRSLAIGADRIATGHYARVEQLPGGRYALHTSKTAAKDQSYALYSLTQEQLSHTLMPVGTYTKDEIRRIAEQAGLPVAHKPDSQEICFVSDNDYAGFIEKNTVQPPPGNFVRADGTVLGRHKGITHYTVGQRKGLGIAFGRPMFVTAIRPESNEVVLGEAAEVFSEGLTAGRINWMAVDGLHGMPLRARVKIRYNHSGAACTLQESGEDCVDLRFDEPQRAVTPGQSAVFYSDEGYVLGGGVIL